MCCRISDIFVLYKTMSMPKWNYEYHLDADCLAKSTLLINAIRKNKRINRTCTPFNCFYCLLKCIFGRDSFKLMITTRCYKEQTSSANSVCDELCSVKSPVADHLCSVSITPQKSRWVKETSHIVWILY